MMNRLVILSSLLLVLASCKDNMPPDNDNDPPPEIRGKVWRLESIESDGQLESVPARPTVTLVFSTATLHGAGPCNHYFADFAFGGSAQLAIANLVSTRIACGPEGVLEGRYFGALGLVESYQQSSNRLRLFANGGRVVLNYLQIEGDTTEWRDTVRRPLGGVLTGPWRLHRIITGNQTHDVDSMPGFTIVFRDGTVDGSAPKLGRNGSVRYFGEYRADSGHIQFLAMRFPYSLDSLGVQYSNMLREVSEYYATDVRLELYAGEDTTLIYERTRPVPPPEPGWLEGITWRLVRITWKEQGRINVESVPDSMLVTFVRGTFEGRAICNSYSGEYRHSGTPNDGTLTILTMNPTEKACPRGPIEQKYFAVFRASTHYIVTPAELTLASEAGMLEYVRLR